MKFRRFYHDQFCSGNNICENQSKYPEKQTTGLTSVNFDDFYLGKNMYKI